MKKPKTKTRKPKVQAKENNEKPGNGLSFPVVGVGASAGGLEAFSDLLRHLSGDTGMAFVFIQHLDPKHESILPEILSKTTAMPVSKVQNGMPVEPNHVYVIPSNKIMGISRGVLNLITRLKTPTPNIPIDHFLRSLAQDRKSRAIGVILSGTGSDGAIGLEAVKAEGGITFAQDPKSAKYDGMPRNAIATGCVDFVLPPEETAKELVRISNHPYVNHSTPAGDDLIAEDDEDVLGRVFALLRSAVGVDFAYYKPSTVRRRIIRRMTLNRVESLADYVRFLKEQPDEVDALYQDMLIKVTGFFRDPEVFEALKSKVFPALINGRPPGGAPVRVWVPGCSTGEEVYSIAISLLEFLGDNAANVPVQIFATDVDGGGNRESPRGQLHRKHRGRRLAAATATVLCRSE